jgi:hypothetical protein
MPHVSLVCKACVSPSLEQINRELCAGGSTRDVGGRFGISKSAVARHRHHIGDVLAAAAQAGALRAGDSLAQQLHDLVSDARKIQREAEAGKDARTQLLAVRELTRLVELSAKLSGELTSRHAITVTVQSTPTPAEAISWSQECLLVMLETSAMRAFAHELLQRAGEDQDQLLIEGELRKTTESAPATPLLPED